MQKLIRKLEMLRGSWTADVSLMLTCFALLINEIWLHNLLGLNQKVVLTKIKIIKPTIIIQEYLQNLFQTHKTHLVGH